jgi:hypothetical protein
MVNIHKRLCAVYGSCAVNRSTVGQWAKRVKVSGSAETELRDLPCADRLVFWDCDGVILVDVIPRGVTINSEAYINTLNKLKERFQRVRPGKNPAEMLFQYDSAQASGPGNTSPEWVGRCCLIHPTAQIWHHRTSTSLGLLKMLCVELTLKMTTA